MININPTVVIPTAKPRSGLPVADSLSQSPINNTQPNKGLQLPTKQQTTPRVINVSQDSIQIEDAYSKKKQSFNQPGYQAPQEKYQLHQDLLKREELGSLVGLSLLV